MPTSTRKSCKATKSTDDSADPLPSSAEGTVISTRRSTRLANKRKSETFEPVPIDDEPAQTPTPKKQKKLPVRARDSLAKLTIEVPIRQGGDEDKTTTGEGVGDAPDTVPAAQVETPKLMGEGKEQKVREVIRIKNTESEQEFHDADEKPAEAAEPDIPAEEGVAVEEVATIPTSSRKRRRAKKATSPNPPPTVPTPEPKPTKIVFDDDYDFSAAAEKAKAAAPAAETSKSPNEAGNEAGDEDRDDDDEGPEDEDVQQGPSKAELAKRAALKAADQQAALQKRKRQERDALFKKQAEERKAAVAVADLSLEGPMEMDLEVAAPAASMGRKRYDKSDIPDILPAELLTDSEPSSDEEDHDDLAPPAAKRPRKITFEDAERAMDKEGKKKTRDERVGSTVFRVARKKGGGELKIPPKVASGGKSISDKRALLVRGRSGAVAVGKKRKGFFTK